ncbi:hypothetical protein [Actinoplanes sp. NPDC051859]|uniref:hypothetical protein n=1 Tax=Actinoplanes sp. NPDC051859 TaxID=3363909 RepID=UPI0037B38F7B
MPEGIQIDTDGVGEFAKTMHADTKGYISAANRGIDLHGHGVVFGTKIDSDIVRAAKERYGLALENTEANLRVYRFMAEAFAEVAEAVARDFAGADLSSATVQKQIDGILQDAMTGIAKMQAEADLGKRQSEGVA